MLKNNKVKLQKEKKNKNKVFGYLGTSLVMHFLSYTSQSTVAYRMSGFSFELLTLITC